MTPNTLSTFLYVTGLVLISTGFVEADIKCFQCYYQRMLGTESGQASCLDSKKSDTNIISCKDECIISRRIGNIGSDRNGGSDEAERISDKERYNYVYRGCAQDCDSGSYAFGGYQGDNFCCSDNYCNTATTRSVEINLLFLISVVGVLQIVAF